MVFFINFGERKARPPRLSSRPACHALNMSYPFCYLRLQEQGCKTKSCEIEALRAGGGQVEIKRKVKDFDEDLQDEF
jgi:hypothetical protein